MVYLILNGIEITDKIQLEDLIKDLPEESKTALRLIFEQSEKSQV